MVTQKKLSKIQHLTLYVLLFICVKICVTYLIIFAEFANICFKVESIFIGFQRVAYLWGYFHHLLQFLSHWFSSWKISSVNPKLSMNSSFVNYYCATFMEFLSWKITAVKYLLCDIWVNCTGSEIFYKKYSKKYAPVPVSTQHICHYWYVNFLIHKLIAYWKKNYPVSNPMVPYNPNSDSITKFCLGYGEHMTLPLGGSLLIRSWFWVKNLAFNLVASILSTFPDSIIFWGHQFQEKPILFFVACWWCESASHSKIICMSKNLLGNLINNRHWIM